MSNNAFEKWKNKSGFVCETSNDHAEVGWLAALRWALRQKTEGIIAGSKIINARAIEAEIKKASEGK